MTPQRILKQLFPDALLATPIKTITLLSSFPHFPWFSLFLFYVCESLPYTYLCISHTSLVPSEANAGYYIHVYHCVSTENQQTWVLCTIIKCS